MANLRTAAALLLIASLLVAVALSGADGRPTTTGTDDARPTEMAAHTDAHGYGHVDAATQAVVDPECHNHNGHDHPKDEHNKEDPKEAPAPHPHTD